MQHQNAKYKNAAKSVGECPLFRKLRKPAMVHVPLDNDQCTNAKNAPVFSAFSALLRVKCAKFTPLWCAATIACAPFSR
jgi:hypothetical protein